MFIEKFQFKVIDILSVIFGICTRKVFWTSVTIIKPIKEYHEEMAKIFYVIRPLIFNNQMKDIMRNNKKLTHWLNEEIGSNNYVFEKFKFNTEMKINYHYDIYDYTMSRHNHIDKGDYLNLNITIKFRRKEDATYFKLVWG